MGHGLLHRGHFALRSLLVHDKHSVCPHRSDMGLYL